MANLPKDRFQEAAPFTYCAVDMFGQFKIKVKWSEVKCYGAMFTCLANRAVHIEVSHSMTTDSFIQALRRLIARKGNVRQIHSDNGPNLVGAEQKFMHSMRWTTQRPRVFFRTTMQIGYNGKEIHQQQATWVTYGSIKFVQLEVYWHQCCKHMVTVWMKNICKHSWLKWKQLSIYNHWLWRQPSQKK